MATVTISPNMNLPVPIPAVTPGPDWATDVVACFSGVDSHNHSSGQGVQITPGGLNINADLTFGNNNAYALRSVRFSPQTAVLGGASDVGCLYEVGVDLYYNDGNGNVIRITQSGSVSGSAGTITGLPSGTASASYAAGTFTFHSATNTPANFSIGPLTIGRNSAGSKTVTITPNAAQAANYDIALPAALPGAINYLTLDASGNLAFNTNGSTGTGPVVLNQSPDIFSAALASPAVNNPTFDGVMSGKITSGIYTPTVTTGSGSGQTAVANSFTYTRINDQVTVFGRVTGTTTGASPSVVSMSITLPIDPTSNFSNAVQLLGTIAVNSGTLVSGNVEASVSSKKAAIFAASTNGTTVSFNINVCFTYSCA